MRNQFTFYRSYYEALKLLPKKDQVPVFMAICAYALDEEPPKLTGAAAASFLLIKPTLDKANEKAKNGKLGGSKPKANDKQTQKEKPKADRKQTPSEKEKEGEIEKENEKESIPPTPFDLFWEEYPKKVGKDDARRAFEKAITKTTLLEMLTAIATQRHSRQWQEDGGKYIPNPSTWLNQGRWQDVLAPLPNGPVDAAVQPTQWAKDAVARMMESSADE